MTGIGPSVLVVDDEKAFRVLAEEALGAEGFEVRTADSLRRARAEIDAAAPDVLVLDRRLPDGDGIDFLKALCADGSASTPVLVVTAYGDVENAVEALKAGAADYLTKPVQLTDLVIKLRKVLETRGLRDRLTLARQGAAVPAVQPQSGSMREVHAKLARVARSPLTPVLVEGPSGVGKQRTAETLHALTWSESDRDAPFVEVNCAALPDHLVESELFGHEKGAFTDARTTRRGLIEMAAGGTLFLDEITELPLSSQAKLLKFLDTMRFRRLGGQREMGVELRVVAATNQSLEDRVASGQFREDLYHRLAVFLVRIPRLKDRPEDIQELARGFLRFFSDRLKKKGLEFAPEALAALEAYDYPGNVRELRNIIERAVILAPSALIARRDIVAPERTPTVAAEPSFFRVDTLADGSPPSLELVERSYFARVFEYVGHRGAAAQALGVSYPTFLKRLRELGLDKDG